MSTQYRRVRFLQNLLLLTSKIVEVGLLVEFIEDSAGSVLEIVGS